MYGLEGLKEGGGGGGGGGEFTRLMKRMMFFCCVIQVIWQTSLDNFLVAVVVVVAILSEVSVDSEVSLVVQWVEVELDDVKVMISLIHSSKNSINRLILIFQNFSRVTLEQLYKGDTRALEISRKIICKACNG
jgi:hypothetical protein